MGCTSSSVNKSNETNDISRKNTPTVVVKSILVIDDVILNGEIVRNWFEYHHYDVEITYAGSGEKAIERCDENTYDLILTDIKMLGIDGFETVKQLRNNGIDTPIYGVTGLLSSNLIQCAIESGMNDLVNKPIEFKSLISKLRSNGLEFSKKKENN